jgi:hypothetical protein
MPREHEIACRAGAKEWLLRKPSERADLPVRLGVNSSYLFGAQMTPGDGDVEY